jgi:hypothetical protein
MSELIIDDYKKEFTNNFIKDEESLIQFLIKKKSNYNKSISSNDTNIKIVEEECILDSIISLIEKKNKEIEQLKSYSIFDIIKYNSIVSI